MALHRSREDQDVIQISDTADSYESAQDDTHKALKGSRCVRESEGQNFVLIETPMGHERSLRLVLLSSIDGAGSGPKLWDSAVL